MGAVPAHVDDRHRGSELASPARDRPAVWPCTKPDVRDDRSEARCARFEVRERLGPAADLDDIKPCACERGFQEISDEGVVFDQKQCGGCRHAHAPETETAGAHDRQIVCLSGVNRPDRADDPQAVAHDLVSGYSSSPTSGPGTVMRCSRSEKLKVP